MKRISTNTSRTGLWSSVGVANSHNISIYDYSILVAGKECCPVDDFHLAFKLTQAAP